MTETTEKAVPRHTLGGSVFAAIMTAYIIAAFYLDLVGVKKEYALSRETQISISAYALMLFFGKLHNHAVQARLPWWFVKSLWCAASFAAFVTLYPFIKIWMLIVFGM